MKHKIKSPPQTLTRLFMSVKKFHFYIGWTRSLFREMVKFSSFKKILSPSDSASNITPMLKFWVACVLSVLFEGLSPYTRLSISVPRFRRFLQTDSTQATQNFSIGVILDAESDGNEIFLKLENFTISRNKLRVQPKKVFFKKGFWNVYWNTRTKMIIATGSTTLI